MDESAPAPDFPTQTSIPHPGAIKETTMTVNVIGSFWWLIFPIGFMAIGLVRTVLHDNYRRQKLELLKAYLDQGKTPPAGLDL